MRQRVGESIEDFRVREAAYRRSRYVPTGRPGGPGKWKPELCGIEGCGKPNLAKELCYTHYRAAQRAAGKQWASDGAGRKGHYGRAKRHGVPFEPIDYRAVFERDGWVCGICTEPVDAGLKAPDPMSPSLDHVVSMSNGGGHLYSNVQCAHLICNIRKGAND